jgi:hypothetical protein
VDSKKFDIAVGDNDYPQRPSSAQPLRQVKIRNSGGGKMPTCRTRSLIGQIAWQEMRRVRD